MSQHPSEHGGHEPESRSFFAHFFSEFGPLVLFVSLFLLMVSLPLVFTGTLSVVGFCIIASFLIATGLMFTIPSLVAPFLLVVFLTVWIAFPETNINSAGAWLGIGVGGMLVFLSMNISNYLRRIELEQKEAALLPKKAGAQTAASSPSASAAAKAEAPAAEEKKAEYKPVAFDRKIAAEGVTIIFGTESGNSEGLATMAKSTLEGAGFPVQVLDAAVVDPYHLKAFANLLIITSTWGEGDPPSNAIELTGAIKGNLDVNLAGRQFSVLSLGDTNYEFFCQCGKDFDGRLAHFGASRFYPRVDCDVAFEEPFAGWLNGVKDALKSKGLLKIAEYDEAEDKAKYEKVPATVA